MHPVHVAASVLRPVPTPVLQRVHVLYGASGAY